MTRDLSPYAISLLSHYDRRIERLKEQRLEAFLWGLALGIIAGSAATILFWS